MQDFRGSSYKRIAASNAAAREKEAKKKAEEQAATTIGIKPENIIKSPVAGVSQVAISGDASSNLFYSTSTITAQNNNTTTSETTKQPNQTISTPDPGVKTVQVSKGIAEKLSGQSYSSNPSDTTYYASIPVRAKKPNIKSYNPYEQKAPKSATNANSSLIAGLAGAEQGKAALKRGFEATGIPAGFKFLTTPDTTPQRSASITYKINNPLNQPSSIVSDKNFGKYEFTFKGREAKPGELEAANLLTIGGQALTTPGVIKSPSILQKTTSEVKQPSIFKNFLKKEKITPGSLITREQALKIQEFQLKYNRANVESSLIKSSDNRLVKSSISYDAGVKYLSLELSLKTIERVDIIKRTSQGGSVDLTDAYMVVRKGKSELINPNSVEQFNFVSLEGSQNILTKQRGSRNSFGSELALDFGNQIKLPLPNKPLTNIKSSNIYSSRNVKELIPSGRFNELVSLKGSKVSTDKFIGVVDSLDFSQAKIFRLRAASKVDNPKGFPRVSVERTSLNVQGINFKLGKESNPFNSNIKIGRQKNIKNNPDQLEDLRFRLEDSFSKRKLLTADNIKEVIEFEKGFKVKIYTFDKKLRAFTTLEAYIPKKASYSSMVGGLSTFKDIQKKYNNKADGIASGSSGDGQASILKTETIKEKAKQKFSDVKLETAKPKTKTRSENNLFSENKKVYEGYGDRGSDVAGSSKVTDRVFDSSKSNSFGRLSKLSMSGLMSGSSNKQVSNAGYKSDVGSVNLGKNIPSSPSKTIPKIVSLQKQSSAQSSSNILSRSLSKYDFKTDNLDLNNNKNRKIVLPDFNNRKNKNFFSVDVRRFGEFKEVGRGLSRVRAVSLGQGIARGSAAATFRIRKGNRIINVNPGEQFYSKNGLNIEKNKFRINTGGELRQITLKGRLSLRGIN